MPKATAKVHEHGDHIYVTSPLQVYDPQDSEIEAFAFAQDLHKAAPNQNILWLKGQYVEADQPNRNDDAWTAGELSIKSLTPVLMPVTVMHDLRSAVGTIADARLMTPEKDQVPRSRIDTTLALWGHRFPDVAEEVRVNASQGTLMQSMECLAPFYDCSVCGVTMRRHAKWESEWQAHAAEHALEASANSGRSATRTLRNVTFTGVGLIFGTRGARGAMPSAHLEVEELAAMHREAHDGKSIRPRRKNTVDIEDSKYEALVAAKAEGESKVVDLTAKLAEAERKVETLEADKVKAEEERDAAKTEADAAKEAQRVAAMKDDRVSALGSGFRAKLDKVETTKARTFKQAGEMTDEQWEERLAELEETLSVKRDAKLDAKPEKTDGEEDKDSTAGLLFGEKDVAASRVSTSTETEVVASEHDTAAPTPQRRQSVISGLVKPRQKAKA